jgi:hypothetical protein
MSRQANKPTIRQADKPTSQRDDCLAPRSCWLCRHCTPFVPCWGEGASFSSQHASRRVLYSAEEDGYIPGWGRKIWLLLLLLWQCQVRLSRSRFCTPQKYCLVWAEPKTIATSNILYLWKLIKYYFTIKPLHFNYTNKKPLIRAFQRYLG